MDPTLQGCPMLVGGDGWDNGTSRRASAQNLEEDAISVLSSVTSNSRGLEGLNGLMSHITKPIATLLDVELRDNLEALERSHQHLNKIRKSTVTNALRTDSVIIDHDNKIENNAANIEYLANELGKLKFESSVSKSAATEKLG